MNSFRGAIQGLLPKNLLLKEHLQMAFSMALQQSRSRASAASEMGYKNYLILLFIYLILFDIIVNIAVIKSFMLDAAGFLFCLITLFLQPEI